jgi:hypothetical protein
MESPAQQADAPAGLAVVVGICAYDPPYSGRCDDESFGDVMTYDDGGVACTDDALVIRHYYFPSGSRRIRYAEIGNVRQVPLTLMGGRYRIWGSGDVTHWFNLDSDRPNKDVAFIIQVAGRRVRPVITPRDADAVAAELAAHGVNVITG